MMKHLLPIIFTVLFVVNANSQGRQEVIDSLEQQLKTHTESDTVKVNLYLQLAATFKTQNAEKASELANKAIKIANDLNYTSGASRGYRTLGNICYYTNQYKKGVDYLNKAYELSLITKRKNLIANSLHDLGLSYTGWSAYDIGLTYFFKALALYEEMGDTLMVAATYLNIGINYGASRNYDKAIEYITRSHDFFNTSKNKYNLGIILINLGNAYVEKKEFVKAADLFKRALAIAQIYNEVSEIGLNYASLALVNVSLNQFENIKKYTDSAIYIGNEVQDFGTTQLAYNALAKFHIKQNNPKKAADILLPVIDSLKKFEMFEALTQTYKNLKSAYEASGNFKHALQTQEKLSRLEDSIFQTEKIKYLAALEAKYESEKKEATIEALTKEAALKRKINFFWIGLAVLAIIAVLLMLARMHLRKKYFNATLRADEELKQRLVLENKLALEEKARVETELELKNRELVSSLIHVNHKNELLSTIKNQLSSINTSTSTAEADNNGIKKIEKLITNSFNIDEEWEKFKVHFDNVHPLFFENLKKTFPELTANDLRECAYMKIKLSTKEVANLIGISPESIKIRRHRIKKKLNLSNEDSLPDFIAQY